MNESTKIVAIAGVVIIVLTMIIVSAEDEQTQTPPPQPAAAAENTVPRDSIYDIFMEGCAPEGQDVAYCTCSYDSMYKQLGRDGFLDMILVYADSDEEPEAAKIARRQCAGR